MLSAFAFTLLSTIAACRASVVCPGNVPVLFAVIAQFIFGYGVGGEYPMAAGSAAERAETGGKRAARFRGRAVVLTFSMQVGLNTSVEGHSSFAPSNRALCMSSVPCGSASAN